MEVPEATSTNSMFPSITCACTICVLTECACVWSQGEERMEEKQRREEGSRSEDAIRSDSPWVPDKQKRVSSNDKMLHTLMSTPSNAVAPMPAWLGHTAHPVELQKKCKKILEKSRQQQMRGCVRQSRRGCKAHSSDH